MDNLLKRLKKLQPEIDYQGLMAEMTGIFHPRRKITELQKKSVLVRVKKGFYVFDPEYFGKKYSKEIVANLLYGPSYLSLEMALSFYGLIPERVQTMTSVTSQKNKKFSTSIGNFSYWHISEKLYPLGVTRKQMEDGRFFLVATAEKALLDYFLFHFSRSGAPTRKDIEDALVHDLRIEISSLRRVLSFEKVKELKPYYKNRRWCSLLLDYLEEIL
jgi:predicted transcriptional regulator of viral defense system